MNKSVFISYRRDDCSGYAGRLEDALERALGKGRVFRDVRDIVAGEDFTQVIHQRLAQASAVLVLIGPRWQGPLSAGQCRIDDPQDFVRMEVAAALAAPTKVIPVLLQGASLPSTEQLPEPLRALTHRQALTLNEVSWEADLARLIAALDMPLNNRHRGWLAAAVIVASALAGGAMYLRQPKAVDPVASLTASTLARLPGSWQTTDAVNYGWGDRYRERLEFKLFAGELTGTASYLEYPRGLQQVSINGSTLSFITTSVETMNEQDRTLTHRYVAELDGDTLRLRLQTTGGFTSLPPVEFTAQKMRVKP